MTDLNLLITTMALSSLIGCQPGGDVLDGGLSHDQGPSVDAGTTPTRDDGISPDATLPPDAALPPDATLPPDSGMASTGWTVLSAPPGREQDLVTGIYCSGIDACVVATNGQNDGVLIAASQQAAGDVILVGDDYADDYSVLGGIGFLGFDQTPSGVIVRADVSGGILRAVDGITLADSWQFIPLGINDNADGSFALNAQVAFREAANGKWLHLYQGVLIEADQPPSAGTQWNGRWSPNRVPPFPADFQDLKAADPSICDSDPSPGGIPQLTGFAYLSPTSDLVIYPAAGLNQLGSDAPGVCVSTDAGRTFRQVPFSGLDDQIGPRAVQCVDDDHCWAFGGTRFDEGSFYIYRTENASAGVDMVWEAANFPERLQNVQPVPTQITFTPDGQTGWLVGYLDNKPLLLRSTDGGRSWSDISGPLVALLGRTKLHTIFALDADNIWVGGEHGALLSNGRGGDAD